jgi:hypothetical protein
MAEPPRSIAVRHRYYKYGRHIKMDAVLQRWYSAILATIAASVGMGDFMKKTRNVTADLLNVPPPGWKPPQQQQATATQHK